MTYKLITSKESSLATSLKKLWHKRRLLWVFAKRDIKTQYAETALGLLWAVIQPLIGLTIFTLFFGKIIKVDTGDIPYPLFALTGMSAWYYFSYLVNSSGRSLVEMQHIIKKVSFPKLLGPISKTLSGLVDLGITILILIVLMIFYGNIPSAQIVFLPVLLALMMATGLSIGIWLSALSIRYRDVHHIVPYLISFGIWVTPVFYPPTLIPERYLIVLYCNPMAGIIEGFRWVLLDGNVPSVYYLISFIPVFILLITGLIYFKKIENQIADLV